MSFAGNCFQITRGIMDTNSDKLRRLVAENGGENGAYQAIVHTKGGYGSAYNYIIKASEASAFREFAERCDEYERPISVEIVKWR
jgi:hypothetical protein